MVKHAEHKVRNMCLECVEKAEAIFNDQGGSMTLAVMHVNHAGKLKSVPFNLNEEKDMHMLGHAAKFKNLDVEAVSLIAECFMFKVPKKYRELFEDTDAPMPHSDKYKVEALMVFTSGKDGKGWMVMRHIVEEGGKRTLRKLNKKDGGDNEIINNAKTKGERPTERFWDGYISCSERHGEFTS